MDQAFAGIDAKAAAATAGIRRLKNPAEEASTLAAMAVKFAVKDEAHHAKLSEEGVKSLLPFRKADGQPATVSAAAGSVTFHIKQGVLIKYEFELHGRIAFDADNTTEVNQKATVEITDVGNTVVKVPDEVRRMF